MLLCFKWDGPGLIDGVIQDSRGDSFGLVNEHRQPRDNRLLPDGQVGHISRLKVGAAQRSGAALSRRQCIQAAGGLGQSAPVALTS